MANKYMYMYLFAMYISVIYMYNIIYIPHSVMFYVHIYL